MNPFLTLALLALTPLSIPKPMNTKPTIVLVHGAFANASSWSKVIPILLKNGYKVTAVQDPMTGYADDVATVRRAVEAQPGPVVLVGHSYGGAVISGVVSDKVKALVYVAAFAPDEGENLTDIQGKYTPPLLATSIVPDAAGFLTIAPARFHDVFAADLPVTETAWMAAAQSPVKGESFGVPMPAPFWKKVPSWYLVCTDDHAINPDLERFYAKRMNAKTTELKSSHVPFLSHPIAVANLIEEAAKEAGGK